MSIRREIRKIAIWNVRGLNLPGKLQIIEKEMSRCDITILRMEETHWRDSGHFKSSAGNTVYMSGNTNDLKMESRLQYTSHGRIQSLNIDRSATEYWSSVLTPDPTDSTSSRYTYLLLYSSSCGTATR